MTDDLQHEAAAVITDQGHEQATPWRQPLKPQGCRMRAARKHDNGIDLARVERGGIAVDELHLLPSPKVRPRLRGQPPIKLDGRGAALRPNDGGNNRGVISRACPDLQDMLARFQCQFIKEKCPKAW